MNAHTTTQTTTARPYLLLAQNEAGFGTYTGGRTRSYATLAAAQRAMHKLALTVLDVNPHAHVLTICERIGAAATIGREVERLVLVESCDEQISESTETVSLSWAGHGIYIAQRAWYAQWLAAGYWDRLNRYSNAVDGDQGAGRSIAQFILASAEAQAIICADFETEQPQASEVEQAEALAVIAAAEAERIEASKAAQLAAEVAQVAALVERSQGTFERQAELRRRIRAMERTLLVARSSHQSAVARCCSILDRCGVMGWDDESRAALSDWQHEAHSLQGEMARCEAILVELRTELAAL